MARRDAVRLTPKGERWLLNAYRVVVLSAVGVGLVVVLGVVGWIEGG